MKITALKKRTDGKSGQTYQDGQTRILSIKKREETPAAAPQSTDRSAFLALASGQPMDELELTAKTRMAQAVDGVADRVKMANRVKELEGGSSSILPELRNLQQKKNALQVDMDMEGAADVQNEMERLQKEAGWTLGDRLKFDLLGADKGYSLGKSLTGLTQKGLGQIAQFGGDALAMGEDLALAPFELLTGQKLGELSDTAPLNQWAQKIRENNVQAQEYFQENQEKGGQTARLLEDYGAATIAALPQAAVAMLTAGGSLAAQSTAGLSSLAAAELSPGVAGTVSRAVSSMAKDPQYWLAFSQVVGGGYEQAIQDQRDRGETDENTIRTKAALYAVGNGLLNAAVEIGGGIQTLPSQLQGGESAWRAWVDSMVDEGKEELVQGVIERALQNPIYGQNNPLFSTSDDSAIFNPRTAAEEFAGGAVVGGVLGGGQIAANAALNALYERQNRQEIPELRQLAEETVAKNATTTTPGAVPGDVQLPVDASKMETTTQGTEQNKGADSLVKKIQASIPQIEGMNAVAEVTGNEIPKSGKLIFSDTEVQELPSDGRATQSGTFDTVATPASDTRVPQNGIGVNPQSMPDGGEISAAPAAAQAETAPGLAAQARESVENLDTTPRKGVTSYGETAGIEKTGDGWRQARRKFSSKTLRTVDAIGKITGSRIVFADKVLSEDGAEGNASYKDGVITLSLDAEDPILAATTHEVVHRIRDAAPEAYQAMARFVLDNMSDQAAGAALDFRRDLYRSTDPASLTEETVADAFGRLMNDASLMEQFVRDDRSTAQKVADFFRDLLRKVRMFLRGEKGATLSREQRAEFRELEDRVSEMERMFSDALQKTEETVQGQKETAGEGGGEVKYSIKRTKEMTLQEQLKAYYNGKMGRGDAFYIGMTPDNLQSAGLYSHPLALTQHDLNKSTKKKHNVPRRVINHINDDLSTALFAFSSGDRVGVLTSDIDGDGKPLLVGIEKNVQMGTDTVNAIRSIYGLDHPREWLKNQINSGKTFAILDEKGAKSFLLTYGYLASMEEGIRPLEESISQTGEESNPNLSMKSKAQLEAWVKQYGQIPAGERPYRDVAVPRQSSDRENISRTVRTVLEARATPDAAVPNIEEMIAKGDFSYEVYSDKAAIEDAEGWIQHEGWDQALDKWKTDVRAGKVSKAITARGWAIYNAAANSGNVKTALDVLNLMVEGQRNAAQALQATRILKKLDPETQLFAVRRSVEAMQDDINERYGDGSTTLKIDPELARQLLEAKSQKELADAYKAIYRDIGRQLPSRFTDKWNAWRYLAMLGNARTHVRNILGNAGFAPVVLVKDLTATAIESAVYRVSGGHLERTKGFVGLGKEDRAVLKAAWRDYANVQETALGGGKYGDFANANKYVEEGRVIFQGKNPLSRGLEAARKGNSAALDAEDVWFSLPHYALALTQYCKANSITAQQIEAGDSKAVAQAREYAIREAQKATYRDTNAFSQAVGEIGRVRNTKNPAWKVFNLVMEGVLPFRKTPANILARGVEYSPIGLLKGLTYDLYQAQKGNLTGADVIDHISAGLTGTGLLALGIFAASQCLVRGHGGDDEKKKKFQEMQGHQDYALELPNGTSVTLDWLAPEALPFFIGVNLWEQTVKEEKPVTMSDLISATVNISEPLLEMTCLQGLNAIFDVKEYAKSEGLNGITAALASAATSYLTQALPTLGGQFERTGETLRMTTYTEKNGFLTNAMQYTLGKASARIPGWDFQQIPYIDAWGRTESTGSAGARAANNFLNPAYVSQVETSPMEDELLRLYEATGEAGVFPSRAAKYFTVDGERKDLTAEEYVAYATLKGQKSMELVTQLVQSPTYQKLSDGEKARLVSDLYDQANQMAKEAVSDYTKADWMSKETNWTEEKHTKYATYKANRTAEVLGQLSENSLYKDADDESKAKMTAYVYDLANQEARASVADYEPDSWVQNVKDAKKYGIDAAMFVAVKSRVSGIESLKDKDGETIANSKSLLVMQEIYNTPGLTEKQRTALFSYMGVGKTVQHYNKTLVKQKLNEMKKLAK